MRLYDFRRQFVLKFDNPHRNSIFAALEEFIAKVQDLGISGELWLDGSFLTEKEVPKDVDGVLVIHHEIYDSLSDDAKDFLDSIEFTKDSLPDVLDMFSYIYYPKGHPKAEIDPIDGWVHLYGSQSDEQWLKGFAIVLLGICDDGFRISA